MVCFCFSSALLRLFFTSNSAAFVGGVQQYFMPPGEVSNSSYATGGGKVLGKSEFLLALILTI